MVRGVQAKIPYFSPGNSSENEKNAPSTSQAQFCSENTPATIEAGQILLALQQLASNSNSANFIRNIRKISKLPESFTTTMPMLDGNQRNLNCLKICSNKLENPKTTHGRRQLKPPPFSHAC